MPGHLGAVSLTKSHNIVISSFCNIVKGQAICKQKDGQGFAIDNWLCLDIE